jgi:uncharacterized membrane protein YqiK
MSAFVTALLVVYAGAVTVAVVYYARRFLLLEIATDRHVSAVRSAEQRAAHWEEQAAAEAEAYQRAVEAHADYRRAVADALLDLRARHLDCEQHKAVDQMLRRYCTQPSPAAHTTIEALVGDVARDE